MADEDHWVHVRRQWNGWDGAIYRIEDLSGIHWSNISGGVRAPCPGYFLHAYVQCDGMLDGHLFHSGMHGRCPHEIKVCIVKKANSSAVFAELVRIAGPKPKKA